MTDPQPDTAIAWSNAAHVAAQLREIRAEYDPDADTPDESYTALVLRWAADAIETGPLSTTPGPWAAAGGGSGETDQ